MADNGSSFTPQELDSSDSATATPVAASWSALGPRQANPPVPIATGVPNQREFAEQLYSEIANQDKSAKTGKPVSFQKPTTKKGAAADADSCGPDTEEEQVESGAESDMTEDVSEEEGEQNVDACTTSWNDVKGAQGVKAFYDSQSGKQTPKQIREAKAQQLAQQAQDQALAQAQAQRQAQSKGQAQAQSWAQSQQQQQQALQSQMQSQAYQQQQEYAQIQAARLAQANTTRSASAAGGGAAGGLLANSTGVLIQPGEYGSQGTQAAQMGAQGSGIPSQAQGTLPAPGSAGQIPAWYAGRTTTQQAADGTPIISQVPRNAASPIFTTEAEQPAQLTTAIRPSQYPIPRQQVPIALTSAGDQVQDTGPTPGGVGGTRQPLPPSALPLTNPVDQYNQTLPLPSSQLQGPALNLQQLLSESPLSSRFAVTPAPQSSANQSAISSLIDSVNLTTASSTTAGIDQGVTKFATEQTTITSLVLIDSRFRELQIYPQPTLCTFRLPRPQKNVTGISITQLKLLTSFYQFRPDKQNTTISILEKDRTIINSNGVLTSNVITNTIRTGSQGISVLLDELTKQMNQMALFYDYPNGIGDFLNLFKTFGDFSLNFNEQGDYYFNNATGQFILNPTKDQLSALFWKSRYANKVTYTTNEIKVAYYYPALKLTQQDKNQDAAQINLTAGIGIDPTVNTTDDVSQRIVSTFQGIDDPVITAVILANISALDDYRTKHTFRQYLVNKYTFTTDTMTQRLSLATPSLNTSLVNLINGQQTKFFQSALSLCNVTAAQYSNIVNNNRRTLAVVQSMYNQEQKGFLTQFGVPWSQQSIDYYTNFSNSVLIKDGINASGIPRNDAEAVAANISTLGSDIYYTSQQVLPNNFWPNLSSTLNTTISYVNLSSATFSYDANYNLFNSNFNSSLNLVDPGTGQLNTDLLTEGATFVCPITAGNQTVLRFHSPVRQTLQIETLPRPTTFRIPAWNQLQASTQQQAQFDASQSFQFTTTTPYPPINPGSQDYAQDNLNKTYLNTIPPQTQANAQVGSPDQTQGLTFANACNQWPQNTQISILTQNRSWQGQLVAPQVLGADVNCNQKYQLNLTVLFFDSVTGSNLTPPAQNWQVLVYHDRAAFQADTLYPRAEHSNLQKQQSTIGISTPSTTVSFNAYPGNTYQVTVRPDTFTFGTGQIRVVPWFNSPVKLITQTKNAATINPAKDPFAPNFNSLITSNFNQSQVYDSEFIRLPIQSTIWCSSSPSSIISAQTIAFSNTPIGQDVSSVTTDQTAYIPFDFKSPYFDFDPKQTLAIDPQNRFLFQSNTPQNISSATQFSTGTLNTIFYPLLSNTYTPSTIVKRQQVICHYYSPNQIDEPPFLPSVSTLVASNDAQKPVTSVLTKQPIPGQSYTTDNVLNLEGGVLGFSFLPLDGTYNVRKVTFRTAIIDSVNDPNNDIAYLGVQNFSQIQGFYNFQLSLTEALSVLKFETKQVFSNGNADDFSQKGGTQYTFTQDTSFNSKQFPYVQGVKQNPSTMINDPKDIYMLIAFNSNLNPTTIRALSGSTVPQPFQNDNLVSSFYVDNTPTINGKGVVYPKGIQTSNFPYALSNQSNFTPPTGIANTQAQQSLSQPIGTTVLATQKLYPIPQIELWPWTTPQQTKAVLGSLSNQVLLEEDIFKVQRQNSQDINRILSTATFSFTEDDVFINSSNTFLAATTAHDNVFDFLGLTLMPSYLYKLNFAAMSPLSNQILDLTASNAPFYLPAGGTVMRQTRTNSGFWAISQQEVSGVTNLYQCTDNLTLNVQPMATQPNTAIHSQDPLADRLQFMVLNAAGQGTQVTTFNTTTQSTITRALSGNPTYYTDFTVTASNVIFASNDRFSLITSEPGQISSIFYTTTWTSSNIAVNSYQSSITHTDGSAQSTLRITNGFKGAIWVTAPDSPTLWGNRNTTVDLAQTVDAAQQIFQPTQRIILEKMTNNQNHLSNLDYLTQPEYPHTNMFQYTDTVSQLKDTTQRWGNESTFTVGAVGQAGQQFNSYLFNTPLRASSNADQQQIAIRGFSPTENSQVMVRFKAPNLYDFGIPRITDLMREATLTSTQSTFFTPDYLRNLKLFDTYFKQSNYVFGGGYLAGFGGSNIPTSNFSNFSQTFSNIQYQYLYSLGLEKFVNNYVNSNMSNFIGTQLSNILPPSALSRKNYTESLAFSILWLSSLLPNQAALRQDWGLGYNLGWAKKDTPQSTLTQADSFYKILDDYIQLRMNPEFKMNMMDNVGVEDQKITREATGAIQNYHGKLLLNNFGSYSQTIIINPVQFKPPLPRLETLQFNWVDQFGNTLNNVDCDWSAAIQINESQPQASATSAQPTLPAPK